MVGIAAPRAVLIVDRAGEALQRRGRSLSRVQARAGRFQEAKRLLSIGGLGHEMNLPFSASRTEGVDLVRFAGDPVASCSFREDVPGIVSVSLERVATGPVRFPSEGSSARQASCGPRGADGSPIEVRLQIALRQGRKNLRKPNMTPELTTTIAGATL